MKTSNKLLIAMACLTLMAMLGSNLEIQAKYKKIKNENILPGYISKPVAPFHTIILKGNLNGFIEIEPGKSNGVKAHPMFDRFVKSEMKGDTLMVSLLFPERSNFASTSVPGYGPTIHIDAVDLKHVISTDISYKIQGLKTAQLRLQADGGYTVLDSTEIGQVTAVYQKEAVLKVAEDNRLGQTYVQIRDKSEFNVEKNVFSSLQMDLDSTAHVTLPGNLLYKMMKK